MIEARRNIFLEEAAKRFEATRVDIVDIQDGVAKTVSNQIIDYLRTRYPDVDEVLISYAIDEDDGHPYIDEEEPVSLTLLRDNGVHMASFDSDDKETKMVIGMLVDVQSIIMPLLEAGEFEAIYYAGY